MSWIKTIAYESSSGRLRKLYDRVKGPDNNVDNIMMLHSLRPHTMEGHMAIYKYVLHHSSNTLPKWFLETLGVWVSALNGCDYCVDHHFEGLKRLLNNEARAQTLKEAITKGDIEATELDTKQKLALHYAWRLTQHPPQVTENDILELREAGFSDGEILEINQVVAYFGYANRTVLGLGCSTTGDIIGLSPNNSEDPNDWAHS
ncbi:carboxymuconolactone decarboxylase family protein [Rhodobacteraceae bacterium nBUS_24]